MPKYHIEGGDNFDVGEDSERIRLRIGSIINSIHDDFKDIDEQPLFQNIRVLKTIKDSPPIQIDL